MATRLPVLHRTGMGPAMDACHPYPSLLRTYNPVDNKLLAPMITANPRAYDNHKNRMQLLWTEDYYEFSRSTTTYMVRRDRALMSRKRQPDDAFLVSQNVSKLMRI